MDVKAIVEEKVASLNTEFELELVLKETDGEIAVEHPGKGHVYIDAKTGEVLEKTRLKGKIVDAFREALSPNVPAVRGGARPPTVARSQAARSLREIQDAEAKPFNVGGGKMAPTAALISRAANAGGLSFEVLDYDHRRDFVKVAVRATAPDGRINDAVVSVYKEEYLSPYAWELVQNNCQGAVERVDPETGMPVFREGATVRVRVNRDGSSVLEQVPVILWLAQKLAARWLFAPRSCETKAKSRAAKQLLNTDATPETFQEPEEIADEQMEAGMVGAT
jgi:hypothetical protein